MRLLCYALEGETRIAAVIEGGYVDLPDAHFDIEHLLTLSSSELSQVASLIEGVPPKPLEGIELLPPIPNPEKILCIGLNYADHAIETGKAIPSEPVVFCKLLTTLSHHEAAIVLPRASTKVDLEAELVIIIGRGGRDIAESDARSHIAGYTCGNDVSARDWQMEKPGGQWLMGKSFDTFAPIGPYFVTADEIDDPGNLKIESRINGQVWQSSSTSEFIFSVDQIVAYVSQVCTLKPGDLIFTGTPPGVGVARTPPTFLANGDVVEIEIESIGRLRNQVIEAD